MTDSWTQDPLVREDADLRALLDRLASTATDPVDPAVRAATLERVLVAASERATSPAPPTWRRRTQQVLAMTGAKVVLVAGVAAATTGGLAATGTLPDPAQQFVHDVGQRLGIGFPEAPGQLKPDREPARDLAPGRLADQDGDESTTGRTYAPGQVGRDLQDPAPVVPLAPDTSGKDTPAGKDRAADTGRPDDVEPQGPRDAADPAQAPDSPPTSDAVPDAPGNRADQPETMDPAPPPDSPAEDDDLDAETAPTTDGPGRSSDAHGRGGDAPPADAKGSPPGRP